MYKLIRKTRDPVAENDEGFTLIELMVVVLIIGILMAIAIPTFLSAKNGANAKAAQENVRNALTTEASYFSNSQTYQGVVCGASAPPCTTASLTGQEPNIPFALWPSTGGFSPANTVFVETGTSSTAGDSVALGAMGKDNNCYYIAAVNGQTFYGQQASTVTNGCHVLPTTWSTAWTGGVPATLPGVSNWTAASN